MITLAEIPTLVGQFADATVAINGVSSVHDALELLEPRMRAYARVPLSEWPRMLLAGLDFQDIPDRVLWASLMVGVTRVPANLEPLVQRLQSKHTAESTQH